MEILLNSYQEAKGKAIELMKEDKVMGVRVGKKRFQPEWFVEYHKCNDNYYNQFIKNSLTNED